MGGGGGANRNFVKIDVYSQSINSINNKEEGKDQPFGNYAASEEEMKMLE